MRSTPRQVLVKITKIEKYTDFKTMLATVGFNYVIPRVHTLQEAIDKCLTFYTPEQKNTGC